MPLSICWNGEADRCVAMSVGAIMQGINRFQIVVALVLFFGQVATVRGCPSSAVSHRGCGCGDTCTASAVAANTHGIAAFALGRGGGDSCCQIGPAGNDLVQSHAAVAPVLPDFPTVLASRPPTVVLPRTQRPRGPFGHAPRLLWQTAHSGHFGRAPPAV